MGSHMRLPVSLVVLVLFGAGCGAAEDDTGGGSGTAAPATNSGGTGSTAGTGGTGASTGVGGTSTAAAGTSATQPTGGNPAAEPIPPDVMEMLDPSVDWAALTLVYPTAYSAHDGVHLFQVPFYVDGATIELGDWSAIPASAISFDPDPDLGGVLVTVLEPVADIVIAARSGQIGGTATLHVTAATPEQWAAGEARYANGVDWEAPPWTIADLASLLLDPNWTPPMPPPNIACNICHTTGAKYFEIQHTPTQAARFSDEDLRTILSMGMKPPGIGFRILPPMIGSKTDVQLYSEFHHWESTDEEQTGLIVYLRSLTPQGQGDILLPDGTYVPSGAP